MSTQIVNTSGISGPATDFTAVKTIIYVDLNGMNNGKQIVNTASGTDFSAVRTVINVNTLGQA